MYRPAKTVTYSLLPHFRNLDSNLEEFNSILPLFRMWRYNLEEYNHLKQLIILSKDKNILDKTIVINAVRNHRNTMDSDIFFGLIFAINGADVKILLDDGVMMHWDTIQFDNLPLKNREFSSYSLNPYYQHHYNYYYNFLKNFFEQNVRNKALKTYKHHNIEYIFYSKFIDLKKLNYNNLEELKNDALSSTIRFFKTSRLDFNLQKVKYYYLLSLKNAVISRMVGEYVLREINPDIFMINSGIYSTYKPSLSVMKKNGIKSFIFGGAKLYTKDFQDVYCSDIIKQTLTESKLWKKYKTQPVTKKMEDDVRDFIRQRVNASTADMDYLKYMKKDNIYHVEKNNDYKYNIALFPPIIWDGNIIERHNVFDGVMDWLISTIKFYKNQEDFRIYIKAHPGETFFCQKSDRVLDLIKKDINVEDYNNLVLLPPEKKFNTYEFLKSGIDLGIVYDGFLGIEIPFFKIPSIVSVVGGYSSVEGGNYIPSNKEQYFNYLSHIDDLILDFNKNYSKYIENLVKYIYWYMYETELKLPTLAFKGEYAFDLKPLKIKDLKLNDFFLQIFDFNY